MSVSKEAITWSDVKREPRFMWQGRKKERKGKAGMVGSAWFSVCLPRQEMACNQNTSGAWW